MKLFGNVAVAVMVLVALSAVPSTDAIAKCEEGDTGPKCANCARKGTCAGVAPGGNVVAGDKCPNDKACVEESGLAVCKPVAETDCDCGGAFKACDVYSPTRVNICLPGQQPKFDKNCDSTQLCVDAECVGPPAGICNNIPDSTYLVSPPDCSIGVFCYNSKPHVQWCGAGEYFNVMSGRCETYSDNPCDGCDQSMCPILSDCTSYAACAGGEVVSIETCADATNMFFSFDEQKCTATTSAPCSLYYGCNFDLIEAATTTVLTTIETTAETTTATTIETTTTEITTTTDAQDDTTAVPAVTKPPTCSLANRNQRYPHESDCKKYYVCRETTTNVYKYVEATCSGLYVFDPVNLNCNYSYNVPSCNSG